MILFIQQIEFTELVSGTKAEVSNSERPKVLVVALIAQYRGKINIKEKSMADRVPSHSTYPCVLASDLWSFATGVGPAVRPRFAPLSGKASFQVTNLSLLHSTNLPWPPTRYALAIWLGLRMPCARRICSPSAVRSSRPPSGRNLCFSKSGVAPRSRRQGS
jgi:hypothetical protein